MDQRVGLGDPKLLPIIYVQQDQFQVIVPKDDPYHQDTLPPAYLEFTIHELASSILPPGRYSIAAQDIMVTGEYEGDERFWLRKKAIARDGDALDIRLKRESHTRPKCIVLSVAHMREHLGRVSNSRNVSPEIERDYIEASSLPILL
jgi:hypothetical protein